MFIIRLILCLFSCFLADMIHLYMHHGRFLSSYEEKYIGGKIKYICNEDSDTIFVVVLHKFAKEELGYLNVIRFSWSFDGEDFNGGNSIC